MIIGGQKISVHYENYQKISLKKQLITVEHDRKNERIVA